MLQRPNKTLAWEDLQVAPVKAEVRRLRRFLHRNFSWRGQPVAVNGVLRRRFYVRRLKLWEYARGRVLAPVEPGARLLDFGGGGTLPPFLAAADGAQVDVIDIDEPLLQYSQQVADRRHWSLRTSKVDLTAPGSELPAHWGGYQAIHSFCVLEHIEYSGQEICLRKLAAALQPGGRMVLSFEFGRDAPGEAPWRDAEHVLRMLALLRAQGLQSLGADWHDSGERFLLDRRHPQAAFTFGMLGLERPIS